MNFFDSVISAFKNYVNFSGRASRGEYWWAYLAFVIASFACSIFDIFIGGCMSLENKICFSYDIDKTENHIGRGGNGSSKFEVHQNILDT